MQLDHLDHIPAGLANIGPREIRQVFDNPTLIHLRGKKPETVFVSTLLHGNETTSFEVLQYLQQAYGSQPPPRDLLIFVGNIQATERGVRLIEGEPDFNRIWSHGKSAHHDLARTVIEQAHRHTLFASIDIHNNTGANPLYGCINALRPADLQLAALFAPLGVFYRNPATTQSIAFSELCPAVTVECGQSGNPEGAATAIRLVEETLRLDAFALHPPPDDALRLYQTVGRVVLDADCSFSFGDSGYDLALRADLEALNFVTLSAGAEWGHSQNRECGLRVLDEHDHDMTEDFFRFDNGTIRLVQESTPAMITRDIKVIRQDCLGYLMTPV